MMIYAREMLGVPAEEAQSMIDRYFERFPGIQRYIVSTLESVRERGYSETLFGRKTWFPRIDSKHQAERQGSERAAINAPMQGTAADIIKRAMITVDEWCGNGERGARLIMQVHDELVLEVDAARIAEVTAAVADVVGSKGRSGQVLATYQMAADVGAIIGPLATGLLADYLSYEAAFALTGAMALVAALVWVAAPETLPRKMPAEHTASDVAAECGVLDEGPEVPHGQRVAGRPRQPEA